jgi:hypothetical protein
VTGGPVDSTKSPLKKSVMLFDSPLKSTLKQQTITTQNT